MQRNNSKPIPVPTTRQRTIFVVNKFLYLSAFVCLSNLSVLLDCHSEDPPVITATSKSTSSSTSVEENQKIAEVNGEILFKSDVDTELERPEMLMLVARLKQDPEYEKKVRTTALMSIISRRLLVSAAKKSESAKDPLIQNDLEQFIQSQGGKEKLLSILTLHKVSWDKFIGDITEGIVIKRFVENEVVMNVTVSDDAVKSAFDKDPSMFDLPEQVSARHILFREGTGDSPQKRAETAIKEISSGSISFEDYAAKFSDDTVTASKGGSLGFFPRGSMVPEFETAAFALSTKAISAPIKTSYGIHLIKVEDRKEGTKATFENSRERVKKMLLTESRAEVLNSYMQKLQEKAAITITDPDYIALSKNQ